MAYLVWGNTNIEFNKEHPYITGVKEYTNCESKSVIFDRSFGFSLSNVGGVSGFLPSEFDIKNWMCLVLLIMTVSGVESVSINIDNYAKIYFLFDYDNAIYSV